MSNARKVTQVRAVWRRRSGKPMSRRDARLNDSWVPLIETIPIYCTCPPKGRSIECPTAKHRQMRGAA